MAKHTSAIRYAIEYLSPFFALYLYTPMQPYAWSLARSQTPTKYQYDGETVEHASAMAFHSLTDAQHYAQNMLGLPANKQVVLRSFRSHFFFSISPDRIEPWPGLTETLRITKTFYAPLAVYAKTDQGIAASVQEGEEEPTTTPGNTSVQGINIRRSRLFNR